MTLLSDRSLPELPYEAWEKTKKTLHLYTQIVGKVKLATTAPRNHWWNVPLYVDVRGLTTGRLTVNQTSFDLTFDFLDHALVLRTDTGAGGSFPLEDGLTVAQFDRNLHTLLDHHDVEVEIREEPFGLPAPTTPFRADIEHASYQAAWVQSFWRALEWADEVLDEFSGWFCGKQSPVHLFWHSFDLAYTRFSGLRTPGLEAADATTREAYSHELISFGFWPGDDNLRAPSFYSYTAPEPPGLREHALQPSEATWVEGPTGALALLPYDDVRAARDPRAVLLAFLESAYGAGSKAAGWARDDFRSSFCPTPAQMQQLLGR